MENKTINIPTCSQKFCLLLTSIRNKKMSENNSKSENVCTSFLAELEDIRINISSFMCQTKNNNNEVSFKVYENLLCCVE